MDIVALSWRNQALAQACAFSSPFRGMMSEMGIFQPLAVDAPSPEGTAVIHVFEGSATDK